MSHLEIPQGGSDWHEVIFYDKEGGTPVDDVRYASSGTMPVASIVTPTGAVNPPTTSDVTRIAAGYYKAKISVPSNATLSTEWKIRWQVRLNSDNPANDEAFDYRFAVTDSGASSEGPQYYNYVEDYRRSIAEEFRVLTHSGIAVNETLDINQDYISVVSLTKNGTELAAGVDYTFKRPGTFTFLTAVASADVLHGRFARTLEDKEILLLARGVKNSIDSELSKVYTLPFTTTPEKLKTIDRQWVRGLMIIEMGPRPNTGISEKDREMAFGWIRSAQSDLQKIVDGKTPLLLPDYTVVTPKFDPDELHLDVQTDSASSSTGL